MGNSLVSGKFPFSTLSILINRIKRGKAYLLGEIPEARMLLCNDQDGKKRKYYKAYWCNGAEFCIGNWVKLQQQAHDWVYGIIRYFFEDEDGNQCVYVTQVSPTGDPPYTVKSFQILEDSHFAAHYLTSKIKLSPLANEDD